MISLIVWIILIVLALALLAYSLLCNDTVPYTEVVALVFSTLITWVLTVLYATGNVLVSTTRELVSQTALTSGTSTDYNTTTVFNYVTLEEYLPIDGTIMAILIVISISLTLYCLYVLIPTVIELVNGTGDN